MRQIHLQLTDWLYDQAQRRAAQAGFANLHEHIVEMVTEDLTSEMENLDHHFSPKVIAHLNGVRDEIQSGAKTYSEGEVEEYLREKARTWHESHPD